MLHKKMIRDILEHKMQFLAIFLMATLTLMIFSGVGSEVEGIQQTANEYYDTTNMASLWVYGKNFDNDTITSIKSIDSTREVDRQLVVKTTAQLDNNPSLTLHYVENNSIARYYPIEGEDININDGEGVWLDKRFADAQNLKINDKIGYVVNNKTVEKTIKGLGYSPEYVYEQSDESMIPDFKLQGFAYLSHEASESKNIPYNVALIKTSDNTSTYQEKIDEKIEDKYDSMLSFQDHSSVKQFQSEIDQHKMMGNMFPVIFVLVSLLTLLTTMTRIVNTQRTQIGVLKSLGFSDNKLVLHYLSYGFYLTLLGSITGLIIGYSTIPYLFFPSMSSFYTLPAWKAGFNNSFIIVSLALILSSLIITYLATKNITRESPATALLPKKPKINKNTLIEKTQFWKKIGFNGRWNYRDINRNKIRSIVTIISIIGCTILLISALGMNDGMNDLKKWQYGGINHYNTQLVLEDNITTARLDEITKEYNATQVMTAQIELKAKGIKKTTTLTSYNKTDMITPTDKNMKKMELPEDGITITEKTAEIHNLKRGDTIEWRIIGTDNWINTSVDEINADPTVQGITISPTKLEKLGYNYTPTTLVTKEKTDKKITGIASTNTIDELQDTWDQLMQTANLLIAILIIFSFTLSVVMLYTLGILSFTEVEQDLATLKVIGFNTGQIRKLFLTQNTILSLIGFIIGIPIGYYVLRVMMNTSGESFYYPVDYSLMTILITLIIILGLTLIANTLLTRKIKKLDMVKALKKSRD